MYDNNLDIELIDFIELINYTLSNNFTERYKYLFSEKLIKLFQLKIMEHFKKQKPLKLEALYKYLTTKCNYSEEYINKFFDKIDIEKYRPFVYGRLNPR